MSIAEYHIGSYSTKYIALRLHYEIEIPRPYLQILLVHTVQNTLFKASIVILRYIVLYFPWGYRSYITFISTIMSMPADLVGSYSTLRI